MNPCGCDSGVHDGCRHMHGGLARPRYVIYMAADCAIRCNPPLAAFYQQLRDCGKQPKVDLVEVMLKLDVLAEDLLRANCLWKPSAHPAPVPA